jgi:DNA mismatch repair protein MutS2
MDFSADSPLGVLAERGGAALQWDTLRTRLSGRAQSPLGQAIVRQLEPCTDLHWIETQQARTAELRLLLGSGEPFHFRGIFDLTDLTDRARIPGAALEPEELLRIVQHAERVEAWRQLMLAPPDSLREALPSIQGLSAPLLETDLSPLLQAVRGKLEPDGSFNDDASPELARIRRALGRQHQVIQTSLRRALERLSADGAVQDEIVTVRGDRFVIPVKAEARRRVPGVVHGSSSTGQTVFVEPIEAIESNNELARLLEEEQAEIHRLLLAMTRAVAAHADTLVEGGSILAAADAHTALARFAEEFRCVRPEFPLLALPEDDVPMVEEGGNGGAADSGRSGPGGLGTLEVSLLRARHPLLEMNLRERSRALPERADAGREEAASSGEPGATRQTGIVPLTIVLPAGKRQMIISGPNTGGKTVALKTAGLLVLMAQAGMPVPADEARLPIFTGVYADIGDAQSLETNLSTFSAHVTNVDRISRLADEHSLVLLDELGSATDPEEGAALAVAVAEHFLELGAWSIVTTHLTALKVYAAQHAGVLNAAVGFDEATLSPTYELRLGVPGASAGLNIAARLGMDPAIVANARSQMSSQQADIGKFLDELHAQLAAAHAERAANAETARKLERERAFVQAEGRKEQQARTRAMERELSDLIKEFETQLRDTVKAIDDKTIAQKIAKDSALRIARLRREFSEQFQTTVEAHGAPQPDGSHAGRASERNRDPRPGDLVRLRSLNREGVVSRVIDGKTLEVSFGTMKTRVPRSDIAEFTPVKEPTPESLGSRRRGGITIATGDDPDYVSSEINVIGRTADEAEAEVDRFVERAFLAGIAQIRVVHGVGMGILRRTLRDFLRKHPHVTGIEEPPYNEGGQGVTMVSLRR